jgi:O-antigen/teichoic acid export membrane protein
LFVIAVSGQIVYYTDNLVVGAFLSAAAVTFYSIGGRFVEYLGQLGASLTQTFMPLASNLGAQDKQDQLKRLLIQGTRAALFVSLPVGAVLLVRGPTFIGLWMGPQYGEPSGRILRILLLSTVTLAGNRTAAQVVFGLGKHKPFALWQTCEAVANLSLSIYLCRKIGMDGVAWGTVLPSLASQLLIRPRYISKLLNVPVATYFWQGWVRPALATAPFGVACVWTDHYWAATGMFHFFLQIAALLPLVPLGVVVVFRKEASWQWRDQDSLLRRTLLS